MPQRLYWVFGWVLVTAAGCLDVPVSGPWSSPTGVAYAPTANQVAVADAGLGCVVIVDGRTGVVRQRIELGGHPAGVAWSPDGLRLFVADGAGAAMRTVDVVKGRVLGTFPVTPRPRGVAMTSSGRLVVCGSGRDACDVITPDTAEPQMSVAVGYQPEAVAVAPDGKTALIVPLLPQGPATARDMAIAVALVDISRGQVIARIPLLPGATCGRGAAISPDGHWGFVTHVLGKAGMPNTHVDRGWVSTDAVTIIDLVARTRYATVLLDEPDRGAADPWGIAVTPDGSALWVALSGVRAIARIDLTRMLALCAGTGSLPQDPRFPAIWSTIAAHPARRADLAWDLWALPGAGLIQRIDVAADGPRSVAISGDGATVAVGLHYAGQLALLNAVTGRELARAQWAEPTSPDLARQGEMLFHDATNSFQQWVSCATCHPGSRADGLNWDLLNDGVGNPKNTRTLMLADQRAPVMSLGVRRDAPTAVRAGLRFIAFHEPSDAQVDGILRYLVTHAIEPSPYVGADGAMSASATRGKLLFQGKASCVDCHSGQHYSDQLVHDVGTVTNPIDHGKPVLTPMLCELWRTAPYLHDGSAATLRDVLTSCNPSDRHAKVAGLSPEEIDDIVAFLQSL